MTRFDTLTVFIDFRYDAGTSLPRDKTLRARVMSRDAEGPVFGCALTRKAIKAFPVLRIECIKKLQWKCRRIQFEFSPVVPVSVYRECITEVSLDRVA